MKSKITTAIIPVAGYGTRRLPITKTIEKCMLPIGNRPIVDYVVADCVAAGITDIWFVVGEESTQIREYFGHNKKLEECLVTKGKTAELKQIQPPENITFHYVEQPQNNKYGTTIPVALALREIDNFDAPVLVAMGDDFLYYHDKELSGHAPRSEIIAKHSGFKRMIELRDNDDEAAMLAPEIALEEVSKYGVIDLDKRGNFAGIVEKPTSDNAPSNLINISKYVFPPRLLKLVTEFSGDDAPTHNGEHFITDPINKFVQTGGVMKVVPARGEYLDGGNLAGWLYANEVVGRDLLHKK
ncbi:sugar phosphate nucleotidyltransferase [Candidatus Saccharibacteria bacterium]|nr:sugar phosphate nucleotidyltransferase [Candidatus Saccharibacteria bacterium]